MADANLFQQYLKPVKTVQDYQNDMMVQEDNKLKLAASRMQGQQAIQAQQDDQMSRQLAQSAGGNSNALIDAYMKAGMVKQAQALQKSTLDSQKISADIGQTGAQTLKINTEADGLKANQKYEAAANHAQKLAYVRSPEDVISYFDQGIANGVFPAQDRERMIQQANQYPTLDAWKQAESSASIPVLEKYKEAASMGRAQLQSETQLATNAATVGASRANNLASVAATDRATQGRIAAAGIAATQKTAPKPMPTAALKMVQEGVDAIGTASSINADLEAIKTQITSGSLKFGPVGNLANRALNATGMSTEESRNFGSFQANMEKLRNDSLRLNKGVQTDGDAIRAWNELFANINDTKFVEQRLGEIQRLNERAVQLRKLDIDNVRGNYGHGPMDVSAYEKQPATLNGGKPAQQAQPGAVTRVTNNEDYARLPSGSTYQTPDGKTRRKP